MTDRELDGILGGDLPIAPSPGFAASVMRAVQREAATPPPLRFPLILALPGILAWVLTLALVVAVPLYRTGAQATPAFHLRFDFSWVGPAFDSLRRLQAGWIALAVLLTLVCVGFPLRLMRGGSRN